MLAGKGASGHPVPFCWVFLPRVAHRLQWLAKFACVWRRGRALPERDYVESQLNRRKPT